MCRPSPHVRFHDDAPQCVRSVVGQIDPFVDLNQLFHGVEHRSSKCQAQRVGEDTQVAAKLAAVICLSSGSGRGKAGDAPSSYSTLVRQTHEAASAAPSGFGSGSTHVKVCCMSETLWKVVLSTEWL